MTQVLPRPGDGRSPRGVGAGLRVLLALTALLAAWLEPGLAQPRPERPVIPPPPVDFDLGMDHRVRQESLHNLLDFYYDEDQPLGELNTASDAHYYRVRHRLWAQLRLRSGARLYSRFTTEWRKYLVPYLTPKKTEIIADQLFLDIPQIPGTPVSARIGRQDLVRGEGFILMEGGPLDGSRSIYCNAILLGIDGAPLGVPKTKLELIGIRNPAWDEIIVANGWTEEQQRLGKGKIVEDDETAAGFYLTNTSLAKHQLEGYYFYKEEERPQDGDPHLRLSTLGARAAGQLPKGIEYALEGAYQFGSHDSVAAGMRACDHRSFGAHAWLRRAFALMAKPTLKVGGIYLSGNDPDDRADPDAADHGWNPLFSRWPMWSELYIYTLISESGRVAYWSNLAALTASASLHFGQRFTFSYTFHHLTAPHPHDPLQAPAAWRSGFFGTGTTRGQNHQWKLAVTMNPLISWHFLVERFAPGDFYLARKDAYFLRWELMLTK